VLKANNDVLDGIRETATAMHTGKIKINPECEATIFELQSYVWDESAGEDRPVKENDHSLDSTRYLCYTLHITKKHAEYTASLD
jgi:phage terminase large subunit